MCVSCDVHQATLFGLQGHGVVKCEQNASRLHPLGRDLLCVAILLRQLTAEVAQCKPISNIVDSMEIVGCSFIIDSVVRTPEHCGRCYGACVACVCVCVC